MNWLDSGAVRLRLVYRSGIATEVSIAARRPAIAQVLRGRLASEAVELVPLIYALCGRAQGIAAKMALAAAHGEMIPPRVDPHVEQEVVREHLSRLLLDLPPLLNQPAQPERFRSMLRALAADERDLIRSELNSPLLLDALDCPEEGKTVLLPPLSAAQSLECWPRLTAAFAAQPDYRGGPAETGALARTAEPAAGFAARWQARRIEVLEWADRGGNTGGGGTVSSVQAGPGVGRALVETARGLLMHEITLAGSLVADYVIVAPTEWNFHPRGRLFGWLAGREFAGIDALRAFVGQAVAALDPCVGWNLEME